ncbi:MAG: hypothetical protein AAGC57_18495 [Pseudomonadota bacterium]
MSKRFQTLALTLIIAGLSASPASAGVLDPIKNLLQDVFADLKGFFTVIGGIAFLIGLTLMAFGRGNAWAVAAIGFIVVVGVNVDTILASISSV